MMTYTVKTRSRDEIVDITGLARQAVSESGIVNGQCLVYVPHTTAGITINENADPSVKSDLIMALRKSVPDTYPYTHMEGNSPAHVKASLMGTSAFVIIDNGNLVLGTWQGIFFCEFDGPRNRKVHIKITSD
ncbi:secondary thiamine-phosphate synthase enzyme YjbQ [Acidobacteriota bacterium]